MVILFIFSDKKIIKIKLLIIGNISTKKKQPYKRVTLRDSNLSKFSLTWHKTCGSHINEYIIILCVFLFYFI